MLKTFSVKNMGRLQDLNPARSYRKPSLYRLRHHRLRHHRGLLLATLIIATDLPHCCTIILPHASKHCLTFPIACIGFILITFFPTLQYKFHFKHISLLIRYSKQKTFSGGMKLASATKKFHPADDLGYPNA